MAIFAGIAPGGGFASPDTSLKEDVSDLIYQPTPDDTPLYDTIGEKSANGIYHYWLTRSLLNYQGNFQAEGFVYGFTGSTGTIQYPDARRFNLCQIFARTIRVTESEAAAAHWAIDDIVADQANAARVGIKTDCEFELPGGILTSGLTGVARRMSSILEFLTSGITSYTNVTGAVSLSETIFNDTYQLAWAQGGHPSDVFVGGYLKRRISGFTGGANVRNILAEDMKLVNSVALYMTDFNVTAAIHLDRNMPYQVGSAYTGYAVLFLDKTVAYKAFLRTWTQELSPKVADTFDAVVKGELTAEWGHPVFHGFKSQYL
jgi:hypothetical protein